MMFPQIYDYENPLQDEDLECPICMLPLLNPVEHGCGRMFCLECFKSNIETLDNSLCPLCGMSCKESSSYTPVNNRFVLNKLNALKVLCPTCSCSIERGNYSDHVSLCPVGTQYIMMIMI